MNERITAKTFNPVAQRMQREDELRTLEAKTKSLKELSDSDLVEELRKRGYTVVATKDVERTVVDHIEL